MEATSSLSSSTHKFSQQISSFVNSPRLLTGLSSKASMDYESVMSPTSILDTKTFSTISHPFWSETNLKSSEFVNEIRHPCEKRDARGIIDALNDEKISSKSSDTRMVLFGSQLKIQIPPFQTSIISPTRCSKSSDELGIDPPTSGHEMKNSRRIFTRSLSASEMELSEDYTCVILHGPNPKMTHIFNNCIVESCSIKIPSKDSCLLPSKHGFPLNDFLSFCHHCKKKLDDGKDIFMYRGDKAFCSHECRHQEILLDEETEKKD